MYLSQKAELISSIDHVKASYVELIVATRNKEAVLSDEQKQLITQLRNKTESVIELIEKLIAADVSENDTFFKDKAVALVNYINAIHATLKRTTGDSNES